MDTITICLFDIKRNGMDYQAVMDYVTLLPLMIQWNKSLLVCFRFLVY